MTLASNKDKSAVLITGASGGIGLACTLACINKGWHVFAAGRDEEKLKTTIHSQLDPTQHGALTFLAYDVCDQGAVKQAFSNIKQSGLSLLGLVNNAGIMQDAMLAMTSLNTFEHQMMVNVTSCYQHLQLASRLMTKQKQGSIVNVSSVVGIDGASGQTAYATSKAAILGMTKSAAKELAALNIRVNAIAPGFIDTQLTSAYQGEKREALLQNIGLQRAGTPKEVAALIVHLLSSQSAYITGQTLRIDGFMSLT
jgi:3-oxoacyl-[acyl-carrier protein] reductase